MIYSGITADVVTLLQNGGVIVMPTDTIYGLVGLALNQNTVERIYQIKNRPPDKPCIILIPHLASLADFGINLTPRIKDVTQQYWPGPTTLALPIESHNFPFSHDGSNRIALRLPSNKTILSCLNQTGPLIATSANPSGQPPATSLEEAKTYFDDRVDCYVDGGVIVSQPSQLLLVDENGTTTVARS